MIVHADWLLTPQRVAVHLPTATGVVADLHLGYNETRRRTGDAIPLLDLDKQLESLGKALKKQNVARLVIAGDLFEAGVIPDLANEFRQWLTAAGVEWTAIVPGNHDRAMDDRNQLGLFCPEGITLDGWQVLHGNEKLPEGPVVHGHIHPALRRNGRKVPCFLAGRKRLVLPAYSQDAAGVHIAKDRTWHGFRCYAISRGKVMDVGCVVGGDPGGLTEKPAESLFSFFPMAEPG